MSSFEVGQPILNSPFEEPKAHWWIVEGEPAQRERDAAETIIFLSEARADFLQGIEEPRERTLASGSNPRSASAFLEMCSSSP